MTNVFVFLTLHILFIWSVTGEMVIEPGEPELHVTAGADFLLKCYNEEKVEWYYPTYADSEAGGSSKQRNYFPLENGQYVTSLHISKASYLDTGFYYCSTDYDPIVEKKMYIYVRDPNHLLAVNESIVILQQEQSKDLVIPCRPTSPHVNVTLSKDIAENTELQKNTLFPLTNFTDVEAQFDPHAGFTIIDPKLTDSGDYTCRAESANQVEEVLFILNILPKSEDIVKPKIELVGYDKYYVFAGQTISLKCSVPVTLGTRILLNWTVPETVDKNTITAIESSNEFYLRGIKMAVGKNVLTMTNVSIKNEGTYTCYVTDHSGNTNQEQYQVKIYPEDTEFLNLTIETKSEIVVRAGEKDAQWIVLIKAYPYPDITWQGPDGRKLTTHDRFSIHNDYTKTKVIIRNVSITDSGAYKLTASNTVGKKSVVVTLLVEDKPKVSLKSNKYYFLDRDTVMNCTIIAFPVPVVNWKFLKMVPGNEHYSELEFKAEPLKALNDVTWLSRVRIFATYTGELICNATNYLGSDSANIPFRVTDVKDGFHISGPSSQVLASDNISVACGVSIYDYYPDIYWFFKTPKQGNIPFIIRNSSINGITVSYYKTPFSYQSSLDFLGVTADMTGDYVCRAQSVRDGSRAEKTFSLAIVNRQAPKFLGSSNMNGSTVVLDVGKSIFWNCSSYGLPTPQTLWYKDGLLLDEKQSRLKLSDYNQSLFILYTNMDDEGLYTCEVQNDEGSITGKIKLVIRGPLLSKYLWWIGLTGISIVMIFLSLSLFAFRKYIVEKRKRKDLIAAGLYNFQEGQIESLDPEIDIGEQADLLPYDDQKWEFPLENLKMGKEIGSGAFGVVVKAEAFGLINDVEPVSVAVKMVKRSSEPIHVKALASELKIMSHLGQHLNVVNLLGACTTNICKKELLVIFEYCPYGNIHAYIVNHRSVFIDQINKWTGAVDLTIREFSAEAQESCNVNSSTRNRTTAGGSAYSNGRSQATDMTNLSGPVDEDGYLLNRDAVIFAKCKTEYEDANKQTLSTQDLLCWAFQVAKGMEYLGTRRVLHGDLAARNILLAEGNIVKICDFGLAKSLFTKEIYENKNRNIPLPVKWMSVEAISDGVFSTQSDIWAFGVVLWELFSLAMTPYPGLGGDIFFKKVLGGYRMERPKFANVDMHNLMLECWKQKPMLRPSFAEISERLGNMLSDTVRQHYVELNLPYMEANERNLGDNDILSRLVEPNYENCSAQVNPYYMNMDGYMNLKRKAQDEEGSEVELSPILSPVEEEEE